MQSGILITSPHPHALLLAPIAPGSGAGGFPVPPGRG
jgi:hypothetical protein